MISWPSDYKGAWTLSSTVMRQGIGLHSGEDALVRLFPCERPGFHVSWNDSRDEPITLNAYQALESSLCTTLKSSGTKVWGGNEYDL